MIVYWVGIILNNIIYFYYYYYSGAFSLESFLDYGSNKNYDIPNIQPDDGCNIQFTSVSIANK